MGALYLACKLTAQRRDWEEVRSAWEALQGSRLVEWRDVETLETKFLSSLEGNLSKLELPYQHVRDIIEGLAIPDTVRKSLNQVATNFATDSLCSPAFPGHSAASVASACVWLAGKYLGLALDIPILPACVESLIEVYTDPDK